MAYVGRPDRPATWKLPYPRADGSVDDRRLPKAVQAVLRDYRGEQVRIPEECVPDVLVTPAAIYVALREALVQLGRVE